MGLMPANSLGILKPFLAVEAAPETGFLCFGYGVWRLQFHVPSPPHVNEIIRISQGLARGLVRFCSGFCISP